MATLSAVLDTSAVIALIRNERGAEIVGKSIDTAAVSAVNLQEIIKVLLGAGLPFEAAIEVIDGLRLDVREHDRNAAIAAAHLSAATRSIGSGLGDRTCMALAIALGVPVMTADREWAELSIPGLRVELIR